MLKTIVDRLSNSPSKTKALEIGKPSNVNHNLHVTVDMNKNFVGLPPEWEAILKKENIK